MIATIFLIVSKIWNCEPLLKRVFPIILLARTAILSFDRAILRQSACSSSMIEYLLLSDYNASTLRATSGDPQLFSILE